MEICTLASSSSGNCTLVSHGKTHILIDAGISLRRIKNGLSGLGIEPGEIDGVLVTHSHTDHIGGIRMLVKYHRTPVYTSPGTGRELVDAVPESEDFVNCFEMDGAFELGDIAVENFTTMHDTTGSVGYVLYAGGVKFVYATDLGRVTDEVLRAARGADAAVIEANYDVKMLKYGSYPEHIKRRILSEYGHLSNTDSGEFAVKLAESGTRRIVLAHLSRENNTQRLARDTVAEALLASGITPGGGGGKKTDFELNVAPSYDLGERYIIDA